MDSPISAPAMAMLSRAAKRQVQNEQFFILKNSRRYQVMTAGGFKKGRMSTNRAKVCSAPAVFRPQFTTPFPPKIVVINASQADSESNTGLKQNEDEFELSPKSPESETDLNSDRQNLLDSEQMRLHLSPDKKYQDTPRSSNGWVWAHDRLASRETARTDSSATFTDFLDGLDQQSDDYDTDLEDRFVDYNVPERDPTGVAHYHDVCTETETAPSRQILAKLSQENEQFSLQHRCLNKKDTFALATGLAHNTFIESFDLSDNCIGDKAAIPLVKMLKKNFYINRVDLSKNYLNGKAGQQISLMLRDNSTITHLCLSHNKLGDKEGILLFEALTSNNTVEHLDLSHNQLTDATGSAVDAMLTHNHDLMSLNLSWNMLGKRFASAIGKALKVNSGLKSLDLSWNGLGDEGASLLGKPLSHNYTLRLLSLAVNHVGPLGCDHLAVGVCGGRGRHRRSKCALRSLVLDRNPLGAKGIAAFLKHMEQAEHLVDLSIREVVLAPEVKTSVKKLASSSNVSVFYEGQPQSDNVSSAIQCGGITLHRILKEKKIDAKEYFSSLCEVGAKTVNCKILKLALGEINTVSQLEIDRLIDKLNVKGNGFISYNDISKYALKLPTIKKTNVKRRKKRSILK